MANESLKIEKKEVERKIAIAEKRAKGKLVVNLIIALIVLFAGVTVSIILVTCDYIAIGVILGVVSLGAFIFFMMKNFFISLGRQQLPALKDRLALIDKNLSLDSTDSVKKDNSKNLDELLKYKQLLDEGIITEQEFEEKKKQLL